MTLEGHDDAGLWLDKPNAISTWTGRKVDPLEAAPEDIRIEDIAHALARQCRFNGHCAGFVSVARHSLWVCRTVARETQNPKTLRTALLHDATEAYLGDLVRPLKHGPVLGPVFREAENRLERVIAKAFDLAWPMPQVIKDADQYVLTELEMAKPHGFRHTHQGVPSVDEVEFLRRFRSIEDMVQ